MTVTDATALKMTAQIAVFVNLTVAVTPTPPKVGPGGDAYLTTTVAGGTPPYSFLWSPSTVAPSVTSQNVFVTPSVKTDYTVRVDDSNVSRVFGTATVDVAATPVACFALTWGIDKTTLHADASCSKGIIVSYELWKSWTGDFTQPSDVKQTTAIVTSWTQTTATKVRVVVNDSAGVPSAATMLATPPP